jgi:hypothetical protein
VELNYPTADELLAEAEDVLDGARAALRSIVGPHAVSSWQLEVDAWKERRAIYRRIKGYIDPLDTDDDPFS